MHQKDNSNNPETRETENINAESSANEAEIFDNVPEADDENMTAEDIEIRKCRKSTLSPNSLPKKSLR